MENTYDQFEIRSRLEEEMFNQASSSTSGAARYTGAAINSTHIKSELENENPNIIEINDSSGDESRVGRGHDFNALDRDGKVPMTLSVHSLGSKEQRKGVRLKQNKNSSTIEPGDVKEFRTSSTTIRGFQSTARTITIDGETCFGFDATQNVVNASTGNTSDSATNRFRTRNAMVVESQNGVLNMKNMNQNGGVNNVSVAVSGTSKNRQRTLNACLLYKDTQNNKKKVVKSSSRRTRAPSPDNRFSLPIRNINAHMQTQTAKKSYRCDRCGKEFKRAQYLRKHATTHTEVYLFYCKGCFSSFSLKAEKEAHEKVCKARRYECHLCKNLVYKVADLKSHMRKHTGGQPFRCEICMKRFRLKSMLKIHLDNIHTKINS